MPPKTKISKQEIVSTALTIVRREGAEALNARRIATELNCSTQPIFSNFATMDELRTAVIQEADSICDSYLKKEEASGQYPPYKASGMAYIRFAKEEKELFKLLYMRDRTNEILPPEHITTTRMEQMVHTNTGLEGDKTKLFHLEMWVCVHGIATMFATSYLDLNWELVSGIITDLYQGLRKRYESEG